MEGARALDIDSLSGLSDAICEICEHSLDVHNDYRGYVPISDLLRTPLTSLSRGAENHKPK